MAAALFLFVFVSLIEIWSQLRAINSSDRLYLQDSMRRHPSPFEREAFLAEQVDEQINAELHSAQASLRSLISSLLKLEKLADKYPRHPKLGGFSARLDDLVDSIKQFSRKLK